MRNRAHAIARVVIRWAERSAWLILPVLVFLALTCPAAIAQNEPGRTRSPHGQLRIACQNCHTATSWKPIRPAPDFNHNETSYPLRGMHVGVDCRQCHVKLIFSNAGKQCADCHADLHRRQMGSDCEQCHTVRGWRVSLQSVQQHQNRFPLLGAHAAVDCQSCHTSAAVGVFRGLSTSCSACHLSDYRNAKSIDHQAANFPTTCEMCHTSMNSWLVAKFDHARFANFPLTGAHAQLECSNCHTNGRFAGTPADCFGCHAKDYSSALDPNHASLGFSKDCGICHTTSGWTGAKFDHSALTRFPLTGAHASLACNQCHLNNKFSGTPADCTSCHLDAYNSTTDPNHSLAGFPKDCALCHSTISWQGAVFDHSKTSFPLTGAHVTVNCSQCHKNNVFAGTPTQCSACHAADWKATTNPNHAAAGFPQDCTLCHSTTSWNGAIFDHSKTKFPLTGAHVSLQCPACHASGQFAALPATCVSCHLDKFNSTTSPNHVSAGFPQDCSLCHNTTSWAGATFNHNNTPFPLTGAHVNVACANCHLNNMFAGTPTDCYSCHSAEYKSATNPNHQAAGFPTTCQTCHTTTAWTGATFNHTWFPTSHGNARGVCSTCHTNANDYSVFVCTNCHTQAQTNSRHNGVRGYVYSSPSCYQCHPRGGGG
ncbi:MAG TPA: hypothetical protein VE398_09680 [Acidobacteriota bacterium]|nr:hypothetical protein [Acidobacteriota bacterium]